MNGNFQGEGVLQWSTGEKYIGKFHDNQMNGEGVVEIEGERRKVLFDKNILKTID